MLYVHFKFYLALYLRLPDHIHSYYPFSSKFEFNLQQLRKQNTLTLKNELIFTQFVSSESFYCVKGDLN